MEEFWFDVVARDYVQRARIGENDVIVFKTSERIPHAELAEMHTYFERVGCKVIFLMGDFELVGVFDVEDAEKLKAS